MAMALSTTPASSGAQALLPGTTRRAGAAAEPAGAGGDAFSALLAALLGWGAVPVPLPAAVNPEVAPAGEGGACGGTPGRVAAGAQPSTGLAGGTGLDPNGWQAVPAGGTLPGTAAATTAAAPPAAADAAPPAAPGASALEKAAAAVQAGTGETTPHLAPGSGPATGAPETARAAPAASSPGRDTGTVKPGAAAAAQVEPAPPAAPQPPGPAAKSRGEGAAARKAQDQSPLTGTGAEGQGRVQPPGPEAQTAPRLQLVREPAARSRPESHGAAPPPGTQPQPGPVAAEDVPLVFRRLLDEARWTQSPGRQEVTLQLEPEKLGRVHLTVLQQGGAVSARLEVENQAAREVLQAGLLELKQDLAAQGVRVNELNVLVGQNLSGGSGGSAGYSGAFSAGRHGGGPAPFLGQNPATATGAAAGPTGGTGLDLRV